MGARMRSFDWTSHPLGSPENWPQSLKAAVKIALDTRYPMWLGWGPKLFKFYNDAYIPILGEKHRWALGTPAQEVWKEAWERDLGPQATAVLDRGEASWNDERLLILSRSGYVEETYFTWSFSPLPADGGGIGGLLSTCTEDTQRVLGERRLAMLRHMAAVTADAKTEADALRLAAKALQAHSQDASFALIYLLDADGRCAALAEAIGLDPGTGNAPQTIELGEESSAWPLKRALEEGPVTLRELGQRGLPGGFWPDATNAAAVMPLAKSGQQMPRGFLVVGASPRRICDDAYSGFFELLASSIATALSNARAFEEERRRAEALAELDRAKTAFFSNVSHEFRTPLTLMLGPLEELKDEFGRATGEPSAWKYRQVDLVHRNGLRLLKLVNTLLDFSRIEAGRMQAVYEPTDLASYTAELASVFRAATEKAGLRLLIDCPAMPEPVFVDREMWEKIVLNLVSNAFKFTFDGEIEVKGRAVGRQFELAVRDTGIGIPQDELPRIFERFHRVAGAQGRTHEGSGIGLSLTQELVRLHGGSVSVESDYGRGTRFGVSIPLGHGHLPAKQFGAARAQASTALGATPFVEEALRWLPDGPTEEKGRAADVAGISDQATDECGERARILLADDNADMRDYVRRLLTPRYEVEAVADGEAALAAIGRFMPDLVLSDVMMPRLDGIELVARLRADPRTSTLPVVLLSARAGEEARVGGLAGGADSYLVKPFIARELLARVAASIAAAKARREATDALRESESRLRLAVEAASMGTFMWHVQDGRGEADARTLALFGVSADDELSSAEAVATLIHPDDRAGYAEAVAHATDPAGDGRLSMEFRVRHPDGSERWLATTAQTVFDGKPRRADRMSGVVADITERKEAEETQRLLVSELSHRVKNTLANVQAIVQHTLRRTKDPAEFVTSFAGRIQSLSRVHSVLSKTTWQGADLRELIRDQLLLGPIDDTRLTASGPAVQIEPQMALRVALMLHELGTNSIKHGALSRPQGRVAIDWAVEGGVLRLHWAERGGPRVAAPTSRGFGLTLIEQSAKGEGGDARMSLEAEGVDWEIALPLPRPPAKGRPQPKSSAGQRSGGEPPRHETRAVEKESGQLAGKSFLVVEDEPLVALDIVSGLEEAGAEVAGSAGTVKDALRLVESASFDGALLDSNLRGEPVDKIAAALTRRKVPFLFVTGYGSESLPRAFGKVALLGKPFSQQQLVEAAAQLVDRHGDVVRLRE